MEEPPTSHAKVQHVYALDVCELSDRLGVSQQELVDGIARDHDHIALQQMLERLVVHHGEDDEPQQEAAALSKRHGKPGDIDNGSNDAKICREACLLLLPPQDTTSLSLRSGGNESLCLPLLKLEDGRTVLEHMLHELFQPKLIEHLVICLPKPSSRSSRSYSQLKKIGSRLCAIAKVHVDFVVVNEREEDHTQDEIRVIQVAARYLSGEDGALKSGHRSDGFLVLRGDRIFDAPTIQMMAVANGSTTMSPSHGPDPDHDESGGARLRALVDLDVELSSEDEDDGNGSKAPYAGIFAFVGSATEIADRLEQNHRSPQSTATSLNKLLVASAAIDGDANGSKVVLSVEKVVASDYCNWRKVDPGNQGIESIGRHTMSSFHTNKRQGYNISSSSSEHSQQSYEYYEFPRERSPPLSHGYHGFKVDTKHVMAREPEPTHRQQQVGQSTSERNPLLVSSKTVDSELLSDDDYFSAAEDEGEDNGDLEFGTQTTVLTEADFDAMLEAKNQAFLFQVRPEVHHPCISPINTSDSSNQVEHKQCVENHQDDDVVFLALPGTTDKYHHLVADKDDDQSMTHQGLNLRRFSQLPSDVQEIKMEAVVLQQSSGTIKSKIKSAVSVNVIVKKQVPLTGYAILLTALCAISSQGAVQDLLVDVPPLLKVFWRMTGASMAFAPLAIASLWQNNWAFPALTVRKKALFALCGVSYAIYNATFIIALSLTSVGHTYIFTNCHSLLMVLAKLVLGQPLGVLELVGAGIGFSGGVITTMDSAEHGSASAAANAMHLGHEPSTLGDMIAFAGAFAGVGYLMSAKRVRPTMGVFVFMWALVTTVAVLVFLVLLWDRDSLGIFNDAHATHGLFGWVHHLGIEAYVVLVGSFAGTMGFVTSLKYFDPLVVSVTMLTEPVVATIFGICVGVDQVPGPLTFLGGIAVLIGCSLVMLASHKTCAKVDVSDALVVPCGAAQRLEHADGSKSQRRRHSTFHHHQQYQQYLQKSSSFRVNYGSFP